MNQPPRPARNLSHVAIVVPALNEADGLRVLLPALKKLEPGQIIVADNGSTDETAAVVQAHNVTLVREPKRGYGAACQAGLAALGPGVAIVAFMDADLSDEPDCLPALIRPIADGRADLVMGWRAPELRRPGALTVQQRFGNRLATALIRLGWRRRYQDLGPFRAVSWDALKRMSMTDRAYGWTVEMQIRAAECGLRTLEIPVPYRRRVGVSKISGTVRGVILAGYWILRTIGILWLTRRRRLSTQGHSSGL